jgi:outer membrane immunogenic protein
MRQLGALSWSFRSIPGMEMGMRKVLGLVGATLLLAGPAVAADLSRPPPAYKAPPLAPVFSWTGWYIGGNAGYGWGESTSPAISSPDFIFGPGAFPSLSPKGFIGGGQIGYNWQVNPSWLVGLEADFQGADIKAAGTTGLTNGVNLATASLSEKLDFLGTVRGRLGWVAGNWLFYGSGGVAYGNVKSDISFISTAGDFVTGARSETRVGWAAGGGINYALSPNWIVGVDYLHYDLGNTHVTGVDAVTLNSITADQKAAGDIVRGVINYKF